MQLRCSAGPCLLTRHVCQTLSRPARYHLPLRAVLFRLGLGPAWGMSPLRADDKVCEKSIYLKSDPLQRQDPKGGLARRLTEAPDECGSVLVANTSLPFPSPPAARLLYRGRLCACRPPTKKRSCCLNLPTSDPIATVILIQVCGSLRNLLLHAGRSALLPFEGWRLRPCSLPADNSALRGFSSQL